MRDALLGNTGIRVSRLCFGTLTVGPLQACLPTEQGAAVLAHAMERGITFYDTAQLYGTYPYLRRAMEISGRRDSVIATKTYAYTRKLAAQALEEARRELNRDIIDIFLLHEQESALTLRGHRDALEYLLEQKQKGVVRAVGASMHHIAAVDGARNLGLDVIHPLLNSAGLGIADGSRSEMESAVRHAHDSGAGVYSMKPLGGGNLFRQAADCFSYILSLDYVDSVAVGMQSVEEVDANLGFFEAGAFSERARLFLQEKKRSLHIDDWCEGCGECARLCRSGALSVRNGKAWCERQKCVLCGYCSAVCPAWAIKIV